MYIRRNIVKYHYMEIVKARRRLLGGSDCLLLHLLVIADDLVWGTPDDAAGFGKLRANTHEIGVNIASCLTTFVDAPMCC